MSLLIPTALLLLAGATDPQSPAPPAAASPVEVTGTESKPICRTTPATGSRLRRTRVCMTAREWEIQDRVQQHDLYRRGTLNGRVK